MTVDFKPTTEHIQRGRRPKPIDPEILRVVEQCAELHAQGAKEQNVAADVYDQEYHEIKKTVEKIRNRFPYRVQIAARPLSNGKNHVVISAQHKEEEVPQNTSKKAGRK